MKAHVLQRILDEQGFIVMRGPRPYRPGEIVTKLLGPDSENLGVTVVVKEPATREDFDRQCARYFPENMRHRPVREKRLYHKVIAE